jgi:thiol-disulfide isomerase/thioredoxin
MKAQYVLPLALLLALLFSSAQAERLPIYYFWGDGCPHCAEQKPFLEELERRYPQIEVHAFEVWYEPDNRPLFFEMAAAAGIEASGVPTTFIGGRVWVGYNEAIRREMEEAVGACLELTCPDPGEGFVVAEVPGGTTIALPMIGPIDLGARSLALSTAMIAFVDGFNPCSLWVLSMLLAVVIHSGSRRKILFVGLTFLLVTAAVYGVFIAGLFSVFTYVSYLGWIQVIVALFAAGFALVNIKDYFFYRQGLSLTIADAHKPKLYRGIRNIMAPDRSLLAMMGVTAAVALGIALVELPCTAGFPVLWSNLVAGRSVDAWAFASLLGLYLSIYLLDELIVFAVAVFTLRASRLEERHGRALKLVGGMIMLALALVLLVRPELMNDLGGSLLVFASALLACLVILIVHHKILPRRPRLGKA